MILSLLFLYFFRTGKIGGKLTKLFQDFVLVKYQVARQSISRVIDLYNHTVGEYVQEISTRGNLMKGLPNSSTMRLTELECTLIFSLTALCFDDVNSVGVPDKLKASGGKKTETVPLLQVRHKWHIFPCLGTKCTCFLTTTNLKNTTFESKNFTQYLQKLN